MEIEFGEWLPDQPTGTSAITATNCVSYGRGYRSLNSATAVGTALDAKCIGAISVIDYEKNAYIYVGDSTKLYRYAGSAGTTPTDASRSTGYSTSAVGRWEFTKYGNKVIATNYYDTPQYITIGGSTFADLSEAPKAKQVATVRDFLVFGDLFEESGTLSNRMRWSAKGDETDFTASVTTQSDSVDLVGDSGPIMRIVGGEYGVVFQQKQIWRMTYVGGSVIFQLDPVEPGRGAWSSTAVINVGAMVFYLDTDGFYMFNGVSSVPIGDGKIDKYFLADLASGYEYRITAVADPKNKLVFWSYPGSGHSSGTPNKVIIYNWSTQRWTVANIEAELIFRSLNLGYTLEGLDSINASIDALTESLDSDYYRGAGPVIGTFNTSHIMTKLTGSALTATLATAEMNLTPGRKSTIRGARSIVDGGTTTMRVGERNLKSGSISYTASISANTTGLFRPRSTARYQTVELSISGGFTDALGVEIDFVPRGTR